MSAPETIYVSVACPLKDNHCGRRLGVISTDQRYCTCGNGGTRYTLATPLTDEAPVLLAMLEEWLVHYVQLSDEAIDDLADGAIDRKLYDRIRRSRALVRQVRGEAP